MAPSKQVVLMGACVVALAISLVGDSAQAQKTAANSYQQELTGSNQNSVYGGYNQQPQQAAGRQQSPVKNQRRNQQSSYSASQSSRKSVSYNRPQQPVYQQPQQVSQQQEQSESSYEGSASQQSEADAEPASYGAVNGQPGTDFPNYQRVPKTSFSCEGLPYEYGMYADEETGCQAYHVCYNGRKDSFLCGTGTVFNQRILHCDYWYSVDCAKSSQYYSSNAYMGSSQPEPGPAQASGSSNSYNKQQIGSASANRPPSYQSQQQSKTSSYSRPQQPLQQQQPQQQQQQVQEEGY